MGHLILLPELTLLCLLQHIIDERAHKSSVTAGLVLWLNFLNNLLSYISLRVWIMIFAFSTTYRSSKRFLLNQTEYEERNYTYRHYTTCFSSKSKYHVKKKKQRSFSNGNRHICFSSSCFQSTSLLQQLISLWYNCNICSTWILLPACSRPAGGPIKHLVDSLGTCAL